MLDRILQVSGILLLGPPQWFHWTNVSLLFTKKSTISSHVFSLLDERNCQVHQIVTSNKVISLSFSIGIVVQLSKRLRTPYRFSKNPSSNDEAARAPVNFALWLRRLQVSGSAACKYFGLILNHIVTLSPVAFEVSKWGHYLTKTCFCSIGKTFGLSFSHTCIPVEISKLKRIWWRSLVQLEDSKGICWTFY